MKKIRAKITIDEKRQHRYGGTNETVVAHPVYSWSEIPEDLQFAEATPSGEITLEMKKDVADQFPLGASFYVDFTPVEQEQAAQ